MSGIETVAIRAIAEFLKSKGVELVDDLMSQGRPVSVPAITKSQATPPTDLAPFISVSANERDISFSNQSPVAIESSTPRMTITLRSYLDSEPGEAQLYEIATENHADIGDRIIGKIITEFSTNRFISDEITNFSFGLVTDDGMRKSNSGAYWEDASGLYVVAVSEITFTLRTNCEQETFE